MSVLERLAEGAGTGGAARERFEELAADNRRQAAVVRELLERRD